MNLDVSFFLLIAALVCITTMTRMVEEERTQIGTLKALGYSSGAIIGKYLAYAGSAAVIGCGLGVLLGLVLHMEYIGFWLGDALAGFTPLWIGLVYYFSGSWKTRKYVIKEEKA